MESDFADQLSKRHKTEGITKPQDIKKVKRILEGYCKLGLSKHINYYQIFYFFSSETNNFKIELRNSYQEVVNIIITTRIET